MKTEQDKLADFARELNRALYYGKMDRVLLLIGEYMRDQGLIVDADIVATIPVAR